MMGLTRRLEGGGWKAWKEALDFKAATLTGDITVAKYGTGSVWAALNVL